MTTAVAPPSGTKHAHHWVIEAPNGAESEGTCRVCGERRCFQNATDHYWDRSRDEVEVMRAAASASERGFRLSDEV